MSEPRRLSPKELKALRGKPCRLKALAQAKLYLLVKEDPPGTNRGPHIDRWCRWANGLVGYPWCAAFVCGMIREACGLIVPEPRRASVGFFEAWGDRVGSLLEHGTKPIPGDVICYRFDGDDWPDHIGFVDRVVGVRWSGGRYLGTVRTVEGNTSAGSDANGGQVQPRWRSLSRSSFIRIDAKKLVKA